MSKFGSGFGKDTILLHSRPCRTNNSAANQRIKNKRFQRDFETGEVYNDQRPHWWKNSTGGTKPPSPSRLGEWKLVWMPRDKIGEELPSQPPTLGEGGEARTRSLRIGEQASARGTPQSRSKAEGQGTLPPISPQRGEPDLEAASTHRSRLSTTRTRHKDDLATSRSGKSLRSKASRRSASTLSYFTGASVEDEEIISRIKGLEDALKAEKMLREKMQSLLATTGIGVNLEYPAADRPRDF
eukprot:CAMPEP_0184295810 /NCGR_PEP_ID=MMETSP1049-20130417/6666_1 /TAXON_ID=77928 /ORGANISM="Proteomonas sulcata, Strain CCMP704" /LENGTH=240 /DNA_ID=CAMNT_0026604603 /DNA_START=35 /DNA_END=757 /DNA_ORIENTATION=+